MDNPKYSIIVVTYNALEHTVRCLQSVMKHTKDFELIIVDNASTDGTVGYLHSFAGTHDNVHVIANMENKNFGPANNQGYEIANGKHIILLNSDTIVTPGWADSMLECMESDENVAIVGPVCNSSNGRQQVQKQERGFADLDHAATVWRSQNHKSYFEAGILYGWCMLINREWLDKEPHLFDDRFENAWEDNDICLRARLRGWHLWVDKSTYIHHHGQGSFAKALENDFMKKYIENGKVNQDRFYDKYRDPNRKNKLIAVYRIANCGQYVRQSLEQTSKFADEIICLLARSQDNTEEIARSFPKVKVVEVWNEPEHPFDEQAERNWLLQAAIERGATWVISVDGDEVYEDKFTDMVPALMNNPNPQVFGYWMNWRTIWDVQNGVEKYRADGIFGGFQNYRFFKVLPGMKIKPNNNVYNHHCGSAPFIPTENLKWLNVRVKHLGYDTKEQRMRKYNFYRSQDPHPVTADVGNSDYHHLIDTDVKLKDYREQNRVTVMSVIKNEQDFIYNMLINTEPIADDFLIVDTGSTDKTLEEIERFKRHTIKPVRVIHKKFDSMNEDGMLMNYAEAKNFAKSQVHSEWILQMDGDELFDPSQITYLYAFIDEPVDGYLFPVINYMEQPVSPRPEDNKFSISETIRLYRNIDELFYSGLVHESLEDAMAARAKNNRGSAMMSPIHIHHRGYLKPKVRIREKIERYEAINIKQFEVSGEKDSRSLFNLALHYMNEGEDEKAIGCYNRSLELNPEFWRSKQNLAYHHLDIAKNYLNSAVEGMPEAYKKNNKAKEIVDMLNKHSFKIYRIG